MAAIITSNAPAGRDNSAPAPALREDGSNYAWRMFYDGLQRIADADTLAELIDVLHPSARYLELGSPEDKLLARLELGQRVQGELRTMIASRLLNEGIEAQEWEREILLFDNGDPYGWEQGEGEINAVQPFALVADTPQQLDKWSHELPLVILDVTHAPYTNVQEPYSSYGHARYVPNIIRIEVASEASLMETLNRVGFITLGRPGPAERTPAGLHE